jgi:hypothetical protein
MRGQPEGSMIAPVCASGRFARRSPDRTSRDRTSREQRRATAALGVRALTRARRLATGQPAAVASAHVRAPGPPMAAIGARQLRETPSPSDRKEDSWK